MKQSVKFTTDLIDGPSLSITSTNHGWIEHVLSLGYNVYATKSFPEDLYKIKYNNVINAYRKHGIEFQDNLGFISHLEKELNEKGFLLPVFGEINGNEFELYCGASRFCAHMSSGKDLSDIGLVIFSRNKLDRVDVVELTSTTQFIEFFDLGDVDFLITLDQEDKNIWVRNSSLRHTFYTDGDPIKNGLILKIQHDIENFWTNASDEDSKKIPITIHCLLEHRKFVNQSPMFDITYINEDPNTWGFSFGKFLGAFRPSDSQKATLRPELTLWLFDPTEKFDLELFIPLFNINATCAYTKNKKAVMFHKNFYSDIRICGDIVK